MPNENNPARTDIEIAAHETLVDSLRNTHALEKQQIQVLNAHLELFAEHGELHARVTGHVVETREQARRLEAALEACGDSASVFKDTLMSVMGLGQSTVQSYGDDAVLKAVMADIMQEHLEIATYRTLITLADMAGKPEIKPRLEETLREEKAMSSWFDENLEAITRHVVEITAKQRQEKADASARASPPASEDETSATQARDTDNAGPSGGRPTSAGQQAADHAPDTPADSKGPGTPDSSKATAMAGANGPRASNPADRK